MKEQAVVFGNERSLVGIMSDPPEEKLISTSPAIIILNSGIVHRVGPNRIYVKMARDLSAMGFLVLRFDFSSIGDSLPRRDNLPFVKSAIREVREAMDYLSQSRGARQFLLIGSCSGARVSFQTACQESRVIGAFLINHNRAPEDANERAGAESASEATARYYRQVALFNPQSWKRIFTGRADYRRIASVLRATMKRPFTEETATLETMRFMANIRALAERHVRVLFVWSEGDSGVENFKDMGDLVKAGAVKFRTIPKTDHTFSSLDDQRRLCDAMGEWVCHWVSASLHNGYARSKLSIAVDDRVTVTSA